LEAIQGNSNMAEYYVKKLVVNLSLAKANEITAAALKLGGEANLLPLTIAVLDAGGNLIAFQRQDGSGIVRQDIATGKAWGALGMGVSSRTIRDRLKDRPAFQGAIAAASQGRFIPVPGGVLICNAEEQAIGAVGISGDASDKDEYCAVEAVKAAGFVPHPEEPVKNWDQDGL
jgi:uncharacterized protein GlcG (DUF336 family)